MKRIKGFNFDTEEDKEVIVHIEKQGNQSSYIKNLVRNDMRGNNLEELVSKQVEIYLENMANKIKNYPIRN